MTGFINGERIENRDFRDTPFPWSDVEGCTFVNCDFSGAQLGDKRFTECCFVRCNLSLARLGGTVLSDVTFEQCKMLGVQFHECNQMGFTPSFAGCIMDNCSFFRMKLKGADLSGNRLREADFSEAYLAGASLFGCDLTDAMFDRTDLSKADLREAVGYTIDPEQNNIRRARFSLTGLPGLLSKYNIEVG